MKIFKKDKGAQSFTDVLENFLVLLKSFASFIEKENKALLNGEVAVIKNTTERKEKFLEQLEEAERNIRNLYTSGAIEANQRIITKIKSTYQNMHEALYQNGILLRSGIEVNNRLMELYKTQYRLQAMQNLTYDNKGKVGSDSKVQEKSDPLALNNKL